MKKVAKIRKNEKIREIKSYHEKKKRELQNSYICEMRWKTL